MVIPAAAHLSNMEQPEAFNNAVVKFLGRVRLNGSPAKVLTGPARP